MRSKTVLSILIVVSTLVFISSCTSQSQTKGTQTDTGQGSSASTINVNIKNFAFAPSEITIKKGDTVIWTNRDSAPHTVTAGTERASDPNSPSLATDQTYSHTFYNVGTFNYHCSVHPSMKARVIVQ